MNPIRVRFAPSPTGPLHIGGVRTALYNYLFAKKMGGSFVLRVEDTDQKRFVEGAENYIIEALKWCGISPDEGLGFEDKGFGPYRQSDRREIYDKHIALLIESGFAYYAFDTAEELDALRLAAEADKKVFSYDQSVRLTLNNSLNLSKEEVAERLENKVPYVLRFLTPVDEDLIMTDIIRGTVKVNTRNLDDKVLVKNDGMPTYHLANIVDDHLMEISHVIRGEEWLPSMPLHVLLYRAFGWDAPEFAHLPLILKPVGKGKLSKRDGDKLGFPVFPIEWKDGQGNVSIGYREEGYLNDAFVNMLAFLGWNPGTEQELFNLEELIASFDLAKVSKSGARFSLEKTNWFNQQYLQSKSPEDLLAVYKNEASKEGVEVSDELALRVIEMVKERAVFGKDLWASSKYFFVSPTEYNAKNFKKSVKEGTKELMQELATLLSGVEAFEKATLEETIKPWITEVKEVGFGKVMQPLRLALVGEMSGPDVFDMMEILGKEEVIKRLENIIAKA